MQRVHGPMVDRAACGHQGLTGDLPSEDPLAFFVGADATEDVDFDGFEVEQTHDRVEGGLGHRAILPELAARIRRYHSGTCRRCPSSSNGSSNNISAS